MINICWNYSLIWSPVVVMIIMLLETINVSCVDFESDRLVDTVYDVPGTRGSFCPSLSLVDGSGKLEGQSNKLDLCQHYL